MLVRQSALPHQPSSSRGSKNLFLLFPMVASLPRGNHKSSSPESRSSLLNQKSETASAICNTQNAIHYMLYIIHHSQTPALSCRKEELRREFKRRAAISAQASSYTSSSTTAAQAFHGPASSISKPHSWGIVPEEHEDPIEELSFDACITLLDMSRAPSADG